MKYLLFPLLIIISFSASAQCDYMTNKQDAYTGQSILITKPQTVSVISRSGRMKAIQWMLMQVDNELSLAMILDSNSKGYCFNSGSSLMIKTSNSGIIELPITQSVECSDFKGGHSYTINVPFTLTEDQLTTLSKDDMEGFRIVYADGHEDIELDQKLRSKIGFRVQGDKRLNPKDYFKEIAGCVLDEEA